MNKKFIEGLQKIHEGLGLIIDSAKEESTVPVNVPEVLEKAAEKFIEKASSETSEEAEEAEEAGISDADVEAMSYTELKAYAKKLGLPARGAREEIIARITGKPVSDAPVSDSPVPAKITDITPADESTETIEEASVGEVDVTFEEVSESVSELENDDLADILSEAGLSVKGKREALIQRIYEGVKAGKIEWSNDDDEASTEAPAEVSSDDDESGTAEVSEEVDYNIPEFMTDARKAAVEAHIKDIRKSVKKGEITKEDMQEWLESYDPNGELGFDSLDDLEALTTAYAYYSSLLIDDEGKEVDEGAYILNDTAFCCGHPLDYDEKAGMYTCSVCSSEYSAEE